MKTKIYRGTKEIGGTCIELTANNGKILWIDLGAPLNLSNPDTTYTANKVDALLISHSHQDHYGLMESVGNNVPIFIGQLSLEMINASKIFSGSAMFEGNFQITKAAECYVIAETFKVKPFLVDHSSPEAFAFLIEADSKRILYSGDFRATGRKNHLYHRLIENPPANIDLLFLEGTMIQRKNQTYATEADVEKAIINIIKNQTNVTFLISSAQNIDRLVSLYRACKQTGKTLVIDVYTAWLLEKVKNVSDRIPTMDWKEIKVYNDRKQIAYLKDTEYLAFLQQVEQNATDNSVFSNPSKFVYYVRCPNEKFVLALKDKGIVNIIYSQWEGYLRKEHKMWFTDIINKLKNDSEINFNTIHTSGHAAIPDLVNFAKAINPKLLFPIHTEYPEKMKAEFEKEGIMNVFLLKDSDDCLL
jgi:ribonuclease J